MKVCFFLQRRFAYIGHAMACHIKELAPETRFCAMVQMRDKEGFIRAQKDIDYGMLLVDEDVFATLYDEEIDYAFLRMIEEEYGIPNLWPYLYYDRIVMNGQFLREYPYDRPALTRDEMLRCVQVYAKAIIAFLDRERPDAVVFSVIGSVGGTMLYHIAKKKGIRAINMEFARIGSRIAFSEDDMTFTWVRERFAELQRGGTSERIEEAREFIEKFREAPAPYDASYMKEFYAKKDRRDAFRFLFPTRLLRSIPWHTKNLLRQLTTAKRGDYDEIRAWWMLWDRFKRFVRTVIGWSDLYELPIEGERFAYFPLHIEPEIAIMRYAPFYTDQRVLIKSIARSLPIDMYLYVKEHPGMVGYRPRAYYKELKKIPNVRVIDPNVPGGQLSTSAAITTVITSTAAWEALLCKKPAITFGDVYFNDVPGIVRCRSFEELPYLVKSQLESRVHDERSLENYVAALIEESVDVDFQSMWNDGVGFPVLRADEGLKDLSRELAENLGTIPKT